MFSESLLRDIVTCIVSSILVYMLARLKAQASALADQQAAVARATALREEAVREVLEARTKADEVNQAVMHRAAQKVSDVLAENTEVVARKLEETKQATAGQLDSIQQKGEENHKLLNGAMGVQLNLTAMALRQVAHLDPSPENIRAAELAESAHKDHQAKREQTGF